MNMFIYYKGISVRYLVVGDGDVPILFLHGWGGSVKSFSFICKYLKFNYKAIFIDFPPFGESEMPFCPLTIYDYANIVIKVLNKEMVNKPVVVGHSFGGRVAILLGEYKIPSKIVLLGSAGLKPKRHFSYYLKVLSYKFFKLFGLYIFRGSKDYKDLTPIMKQTFKNIVNTYLDSSVKKIKVKTLIFWGKKDKETPLYMAKRLNKYITNSELVIIKDAGHFSYVDDFNTFIHTLNYFILS